MSKTVFRDLDDLEEAVKMLAEAAGVKAGLFRDVPTYRWFGTHVGDYPMPEGLTAADLGKCAHVIRVEGVDYEIGVRQEADGTYRLLFDFWGSGAKLAEIFGHPDGVRSAAGRSLGALTRAYNLLRAEKQAIAEGYMVKKTVVNGIPQLQMQSPAHVKAAKPKQGMKMKL